MKLMIISQIGEGVCGNLKRIASVVQEERVIKPAPIKITYTLKLQLMPIFGNV